MDKLTFISNVMQVPDDKIVVVTDHPQAQNMLPGCIPTAYARYFNSGACAAAWAESYPDKMVEQALTIIAVDRADVPVGERRC